MNFYGVPLPDPEWFWTAHIGTGALLVAAAWLGARRRRMWLKTLRTPSSHHSFCCLTCGYDVAGNSSGTCPECGTDLLTSGVATPRQRQQLALPPLLRALMWTGLVLLIGVPLTALAAAVYLPRERLIRVDLDLQGPLETLDEATWKAVEAAEARLGDGAYPSTWPGGPDPLQWVVVSPRLTVWYPEQFVPGLAEQPLTQDEMLRHVHQWQRVEFRLSRSDRRRWQGMPSPYRGNAYFWHAWRRGPGPASALPDGPPTAARQAPVPLDVAIADAVRGLNLPDTTLVDDQLLAFLSPLAPPVPPQHMAAETDALSRLNLMQPLTISGSRESASEVIWLWVAACAGFWTLVWLAGLPGVLRRRSVRGALSPPGAFRPSRT